LTCIEGLEWQAVGFGDAFWTETALYGPVL
jgi:hypothetical protein